MLNNFILQTVSAPGTAVNCNLITAPAGRLNFSQKFTTGAVMFYFLDDGTQTEWGIATLTTGSPDVLARTTVIGNSAGTTARLNFAGSTRAYNECPGENTLYKDSTGTANLGLTAIVEPANGTQTLALTNSGSSGINLKLTGNGATTPSKTIRVQGGAFQVVNNAGTAAPLSLTDAGALTLTAGLTATTGTFSGAMTAPSLVLSGNLNAAGVALVSSGIGTATLTAGSSTYSGYCGFVNASGTQIGYVGYAAAGGPINLVANAGTSGFACNTTFNAANNISSNTGYLCRSGQTGSFGANNFNLYYTGSNVSLYIDATFIGTISTTSDARVKHAVRSLPDDALDRVMKLRPVSYRFKDTGIFQDDGIAREGLIAQEVEAVIPSGVSGDETKSLNPLPLIALTVKAVQEMLHRISGLEARLHALETA